MGARHDVPLETVEGVRTTASSGERILLGLALIALLGGAMIGFSNLLGVNLEATATDTPRPTVEGSPTPRPTASPRPPREFVLDTTPDPVVEPSDEHQSYWMRALVDIPVYDRTSLGATPRATLLAGEAAIGYDYPTDDAQAAWVMLEKPWGGYWMPTRADGQDLVRRYEGSYRSSGWVNSVAAGPNGFLAVADSGLLSSVDGASWAASTLPEDTYDLAGAAWGPAGWIRITNGRYDASTALQRSDDGVTWHPLGRVPGRHDYLCCWAIHGSDFGYLMIDDQGAGAWVSVDGIAWREMNPLPNVRHSHIRVAATPSGFFAWLLAYDDLRGERAVAAAFSGDGRQWTEVDGGPSGGEAHVVQVGDRLVGVDTARVSGASVAWVGSFVGAGVAWERAPTDAFGGSEILALVSDGSTAYAFGRRAASGEPTVWVGDGTAWVAQPLPASFDGAPSQAAAGPTGVTVVGTRPNARGDNPIFWHLTDAGSWQAERDPVIDLVPERPRVCGELPSDILGLMTGDTIGLMACFDDARVTVRAWMMRCPWCEEWQPDHEPWWLYGERWMLAPITSVDWGSISLAVPPSIEELSEWDGAWVEVTGHYRDPAAATCHYIGPMPEGYEDEEWLTSWCGQRFVADSITLVDGP